VITDERDSMTQATATSPWDPPREMLGCCVDRPHPKGCEIHTCMHLPDAKTCGDCVHHSKCTTMFGAHSEDTACQFFPRRFIRVTDPRIDKIARALVPLSKSQRRRVMAMLDTPAVWGWAANEHAKLERTGIVARWIQANGMTRASLTEDGYYVAWILKEGVPPTFDGIKVLAQTLLRERPFLPGELIHA
jgi:hypothetical protein